MSSGDSTEFDAIVIGSGISGGWAAKELTEQGLKTLLVERGRNVEHRRDYVTESQPPWAFSHGMQVPKEELQTHWSIQKNSGWVNEATKHFFTKDSEHQYVQEKPFNWIRGFQLGGKSLTWGRASWRWGPQDFEANAKDGHGCDWPVRYADLAPWYSHVERFAGIAGDRDGIWHLPDGEFQPAIGMNVVELHIKSVIEQRFPGRHLINMRSAHLTQPTQEQITLGRSACQSRNECARGCSFGAYFSTQSATLPAALRTGNLTVLTDTVVHSVLYDPTRKRASGVRLIDAHTRQGREIHARVVFVCASTLGSTQILLNSMSSSFPKGIGNRHGILGHYLMDHVWGGGGRGVVRGFEEHFYRGRRPASTYVPRFRNIEGDRQTFLRGYGFGGAASREGWEGLAAAAGIGKDLKASIRKPGGWSFGFYGIGEMLPRYENTVRLDPHRTDAYGIPLLSLNCQYSENERLMVQDMARSAEEMLKAAGLEQVRTYASNPLDTPGNVIHEAGTARMGRDSKTSYLNGYNQCHEVPNLFVTDGAALASNACVNPSLTFMAFTARAADYAVTQLKAGKI